MIGIISLVLVYSAQADPWHLLPQHLPQALVSSAVCELLYHKNHSFVAVTAFCCDGNMQGTFHQYILYKSMCIITMNLIWDFSFIYIYDYMHVPLHWVHPFQLCTPLSELLIHFCWLYSCVFKHHHFSIKDKFVGMSHFSWLSFQHSLNGGTFTECEE